MKDNKEAFGEVVLRTTRDVFLKEGKRIVQVKVGDIKEIIKEEEFPLELRRRERKLPKTARSPISFSDMP